MLNKEQLVSMTWHKKVRDYYINKGYRYTHDKDTFMVKAEDLHLTSRKLIVIQCDACGACENAYIDSYMKNSDEYDVYICNNCFVEYKNHIRKTKRSYELFEIISSYCNENNYELLTKREDMTDRQCTLEYICPKHGLFKTTINSALQNKKCYQCSRETACKKASVTRGENNKEYYYGKILDACNLKGYTLLSSVDICVNNTSYITYLCPKHGKHKMRIHNIISGRGCPDCAKEYLSDSLKFSKEKVLSIVEEVDGVIINPEDYINSTAKNLKFECCECRDIFESSLVNFTQHGIQRCPKCAKLESQGERKVRKILEDLEIKFEQEKWWNECRDKKPMPFDFYLPEYNCVIEVMGSQHFCNKGAFGHRFDYIKKHDAMKFYYCWLTGINYLEIKYYQLDKSEQMILDKIKEIENNTHKDIV